MGLRGLQWRCLGQVCGAVAGSQSEGKGTCFLHFWRGKEVGKS
jgi:hypothetical protein